MTRPGIFRFFRSRRANKDKELASHRNAHVAGAADLTQLPDCHVPQQKKITKEMKKTRHQGELQP